MSQSVVEGAANEFCELPIPTANERSEIPEDALVIQPGMLVAAPGVDRIASALDMPSLHRLAERGERYAMMGAQLDDEVWTRSRDEPVREGHVTPPGADGSGPRWRPEGRLQSGRGQSRMQAGHRTGFIEDLGVLLPHLESLVMTPADALDAGKPILGGSSGQTKGCAARRARAHGGGRKARPAKEERARHVRCAGARLCGLPAPTPPVSCDTEQNVAHPSSSPCLGRS